MAILHDAVGAQPGSPVRTFQTTKRRLSALQSSGTEETVPAAKKSAIPSPVRITIDDIEARRKRDGRLVAGVAALADTDTFKTSPNWRELPKARRWDHLLSKESASRGPCVLKQAAKHLKKPGMISLGGGLPSPENFPIQSLSVRVPAGPTVFTEAAAISDEAGVTSTLTKYGTTRPVPGEPQPENDLCIALNYGQANGTAQLLRWVTEHAELVNHPPYADWTVCLTVGSTGALEQALRIFCDRERGDAVLTECFSFSSALETAVPLGIRVVGVDIDAEGLLPDALDSLLTNWDVQARGGTPKPHLLYTVPSGQNPTGTTQSLARRQAIYDVCSKHDVYILEDEPYYYLQMPEYQRNRPDEAAEYTVPSSPEAFLDSLVPTMVSIDVDGRVMRMDSFSKVLVPGSRVGWITASQQICERFQRHGETCNQGPSGISQAVLYQIVETTWGHRGWLNWLASLQHSYTQRRNALLDACEDHLSKDIVSWTPPRTGMFLWLTVDHTKHPDHGKRSIVEIEEEIFDACIEKGTLVARGSWFQADPDQPVPGLSFRATFASASHEAMNEAIRRFGEAVKENFKL